MPPSNDVTDLLPLTPRVFLILWALATGKAQHGYALLREVEALSRGQVNIKPGSLYEAIDTLARRGLIEEIEAVESGGGPRRRPYRLTPFGRAVFEAEAARLDAMVADLRDAKLTG